MLTFVLTVVHLPFWFFLLFPAAVHALNVFSRKKKPSKVEKELDFGVIITAYKDIQICHPLVRSLFRQSYSRFEVYLVADDCDLSGWELEHPRLHILQAPSALNSKVKSMQFAREHFIRQHEAVIIFDPDNLAHPEVLEVSNRYLQAGYAAVQGQRIPKNLDTFIARIDGMCEAYYNYAMRYQVFRLGASSTIAGSGMAFLTPLFDHILQLDRMVPQPGEWFIDEDKIIQLGVVKKGQRIAFAPESFTYDEKVSGAQQMQKQRSRWFTSHFLQMPMAAQLSFSGLLKGNLNQILFGISAFYPPLFLLAISSFILCLLDLILWIPGLLITLGAGGIFVGNFVLALYKSRAEKEIWQAFGYIPVFVWYQILALLRIKRVSANQSPTEPRHVRDIEEVLSDRSSYSDNP